MHQFVVWTALTEELLGCNLQHYNFDPMIEERTHALWDLPCTWRLKAQLVFGNPDGSIREKHVMPLPDRLRLFGDDR